MSVRLEKKKRILDTARRAFEEKGYDGVRMQEIADRAGISKAALLYHFRSKDQLFGVIFHEALDNYVKIINTWLDNNQDWEEKLSGFIAELLHFIEKGSMLFLIREINRDPELVTERIRRAQPSNRFVTYFDGQWGKGNIRKMDNRLLYIMVNSLCCFPAINRDMFRKALRLTAHEYDDMMKGYAVAVARFLVQALQRKK